MGGIVTNHLTDKKLVLRHFSKDTEMDGVGGDYPKRNESEGEKQRTDCVTIWNLEKSI